MVGESDNFKAEKVILAGGTMKPYETLKEQLLLELKTRETDWFNCAHVISPSQMKAMVIKSGITNHKFEFNYSNAQGQGFSRQLRRSKLLTAHFGRQNGPS